MRSLLPGCASPKVRKDGRSDSNGRTHLYLNIYDLTPMNNYLYLFGLGVFHSGIEVHGMEYGFGALEYPTSGVFEVEPRCCPGFVFRRSVWLGTTDMSRSEFRMFIEDLAGKYRGDTYHLFVKNCNHFTDDVCMHLTGKPIPGWVNRLARLGSFCNCLLPESIQVKAVGNLPAQPALSVNGIADHQLLFCSGKTISEDELVSFTSSTVEESDQEDPDHQLLLTPSDDPAHLRDKQLRPVKDVQ